MSTPNKPLPITPDTDPVDDDFAPLLEEPFANAWSVPSGQNANAPAIRSRLLKRLEASLDEECVMHTVRRQAVTRTKLGAGVVSQTLYHTSGEQPKRPGEPTHVRLIYLDAGVILAPDLLGSQTTLVSRHREWLVLEGRLQHGTLDLSQRDYHVTPEGRQTPSWLAPDGALLFLRESEPVSAPGAASFTVIDQEAGWQDFVPGIKRRILWQHAGQAAMLYYTQNSAQVPPHTHDHDEECLMLQGELFLNDVLLRQGDYQLAPAGSEHRITATDTGAVIYAHGDLDLRVVE